MKLMTKLPRFKAKNWWKIRNKGDMAKRLSAFQRDHVILETKVQEPVVEEKTT